MDFEFVIKDLVSVLDTGEFTDSNRLYFTLEESYNCQISIISPFNN